MSKQKDHDLKGNLDRVYKTILQSAKGIRADEVAEKLSIDRTTVYTHLNSLKLRGLVESDQGIWHAKAENKKIKPLEKEIVIELPLPKNQWQQEALLEMMAREAERHKYPTVAETYRIPLEKLRETRTIKIKGKNVDDLDLEKLGNMIRQANERSSRISLKGFLKNLRRSSTKAGETQKS